MTVGNGGFSLRTKKILDVMKTTHFPFLSNVNEDVQICRYYRKELEEVYDLKFAPQSLASLFSYERDFMDTATFGFHGLFNMHRHLSDDEILDVVSQLNSTYINSIEFSQLLVEYFLNEKIFILKEIISITSKKINQTKLKFNLINILNDKLLAESLYIYLEKILIDCS
jgi:hypothetical protein